MLSRANLGERTRHFLRSLSGRVFVYAQRLHLALRQYKGRSSRQVVQQRHTASVAMDFAQSGKDLRPLEEDCRCRVCEGICTRMRAFPSRYSGAINIKKDALGRANCKRMKQEKKRSDYGRKQCAEESNAIDEWLRSSWMMWRRRSKQ